VKHIPLTQGQFAIVDDEDFEALTQYKWHAMKDCKTYYAARSERGARIRMHRQIMNAPVGLEVDHINHEGLDNRRINLRLCSVSQNRMNEGRKREGVSSRYKGVCWAKATQKWQTSIGFQGKVQYLGQFDTEEEAHAVYLTAAKRLFGEFACSVSPL
jgi:hypothetical protein